MFGKRFEKEYELVTKTLEDEEGEKFLRSHLKPLVDSIVDTYAKTDKARDVDRSDLYNAAFKHLRIAASGYKRKADQMQDGKNDIYYFTTYFTWYARQGIVEYLNSLDN